MNKVGTAHSYVQIDHSAGKWVLYCFLKEMQNMLSQVFLKTEVYILVIIVDKVKSYKHILSLNLNQIKGNLYEESFMLKNRNKKNIWSMLYGLTHNE